MDVREYARAFDQVERDYEHAVAAFGVPFEASESCSRSRRAEVAAACSCHCENGEGSLWRGWISPACLACRKGERTATFFIDLRCTRNCYFCFNPNQDHYEYFLTHKRDIVGELEAAHASGAQFDCLAVTGGEPLLHRKQVESFIRRAKELYPGVHVRLYTCGDLLDGACLAGLVEAGLDEMRLSIKPEDVPCAEAPIFNRIVMAVSALPSVVVEMPVIPGSIDAMRSLLLRLDSIGVRGVNLLEFCFPLCNEGEFQSRGFKLRKRPFNYLYDYWYGGGVPVAGSESEALTLLSYASESQLKLGVHYCSSDNKNTGQIYQQNKVFLEDGALEDAYPWLSFDEDDNLLKCIKAFGEEAAAVRGWAQLRRLAFNWNGDVPSVAIPLTSLKSVREAFPKIRFVESANVFEERHGELYLRELGIRNLAAEGHS